MKTLLNSILNMVSLNNKNTWHLPDWKEHRLC